VEDTTSTVRKPKVRKVRATAGRVISAPTAIATVTTPAPRAVAPKPTCSISGSRNDAAPSAMRNGKLPSTPMR
jgi:hypothetical protein